MSWIVWPILAIGILAFVAGRLRALTLSRHTGHPLHSRPGYHGAFLALYTLVPAILVLAVWSIAQPLYLDRVISEDLAGLSDADGAISDDFIKGQVAQVSRVLDLLTEEDRAAIRAGQRTLSQVLSEKGVAIGARTPAAVLDAAERYAELSARGQILMIGAVYGVALLGLFIGYLRLSTTFRARVVVEGFVRSGMVVASTLAVLTTIGIVASMLSESLDFFSRVPPLDFFTGTVWEPRFSAPGRDGAGQFGIVPLLWGTLYISAIALLVAVPIGLYAAVYLSEYAGPALRGVAKPLLEILAGIPSIVYGFFALNTLGPLLRDLGVTLGLGIQANSVLTAGVIMGVMIIPFVSSLSDDIINAVPQSLRNGSLALGATTAETVRRVVMPAALPGIAGACLLAASRAIGETMIVVLAAGIAANISFNPGDAMTTITVKIVSQLTGDYEFDSPQTLAAFALGLTLFTMTLVLNVAALQIVRHYREQYE